MISATFGPGAAVLDAQPDIDMRPRVEAVENSTRENPFTPKATYSFDGIGPVLYKCQIRGEYVFYRRPTFAPRSEGRTVEELRFPPKSLEVKSDRTLRVVSGFNVSQYAESHSPKKFSEINEALLDAGQ